MSRLRELSEAIEALPEMHSERWGLVHERADLLGDAAPELDALIDAAKPVANWATVTKRQIEDLRDALAAVEEKLR